MGCYSRLLEVKMYFLGRLALFLTFSEALSILSFGLADTLGSMHWRQFRWRFLFRCGTDPNLEAELIAWESTDLYVQEPDITVVANTRWLGSMAGRWLGGPMAAMGPVMEKADKGSSTHPLALLAFERVKVHRATLTTDVSSGRNKVSYTA